MFHSAKTGEPLENGRHWFDEAVMEAAIKNFRWHDLRHTFASRLRMLNAVVSLLGTSDPTSDTGQNGATATTLQVAAG